MEELQGWIPQPAIVSNTKNHISYLSIVMNDKKLPFDVPAQDIFFFGDVSAKLGMFLAYS